ncbi:hypothetical protein AB0L14_12400 [Streptomyces sp. NPDC052727]|uniref:hypothetical protein n=1 Tax=Streptomyces sp. NPDC052727 TaxID=3154854 RepID=UPI003420C721
MQLLVRTLGAADRPGGARGALRLVAGRFQRLSQEVNDLTTRIATAITLCALPLLARYDVGPDTAAAPADRPVDCRSRRTSSPSLRVSVAELPMRPGAVARLGRQ